MKFRFSFILALLALALHGCTLADDITPPPGYQSPTPPPTMGPLFPASPPNLSAGAAIFAEKCAACHGAQGLGDGPQAANLPKQPVALGKPEISAAAIPANWYTTVTLGKIENFMPPFTSLSDQERWDVVAYSLSLGTTDEQLAQGKAVYEANCTDCHGTDGTKSEQSNFTDQARMARLSLNDLLDFIDEGLDPGMPAFESKLSEAERYAAAAYVRSLAFAAPTAAETPVATPTPTLEPAGGTPENASEITATPAGTEAVSPNSTPPSETVGTLGGKVVNGSGGPVPAGLQVVLHIFEHDPATNQFGEVSSQEMPLGADGSYTFADLPMPSGKAFYVSIDYAGTTYGSEPLVPVEGQSNYDLPVTIYDTTMDTSGLVVDQVHILLDYSKADVIQVVEVYVISNPGTKTVIAQNDGDPIVAVPLPGGYKNLQIQDGVLGERYLSTADGFADTSPIMPSSKEYQLIFAFDLPYSSNFEFTQPFSLNVSAVKFLVTEGVKVQGQNLVDGGLSDMGNGGGTFQIYDAGSRKTGESLSVTVSGSKKTSAAAVLPNSDATRNMIMGIAVLGLTLLLGGVWLHLRGRRLTQDNQDFDEEEDDDETDSTDETLDAIIALDDQHNAGNISEKAYKQRRAELKAKLKGKL